MTPNVQPRDPRRFSYPAAIAFSLLMWAIILKLSGCHL